MTREQGMGRVVFSTTSSPSLTSRSIKVQLHRSGPRNVYVFVPNSLVTMVDGLVLTGTGM